MTARGWLGFLVALAIAGIAILVWLRAEGDAPSIEGPAAIKVGAEGGSFEFTLTDAGSGPRSVRATVRQAGEDSELLLEQFPGSLLWGGTSPDGEHKITLEIHPKAQGLIDGEATLSLIASDWSWRGSLSGNATELEVPVTVDRKNPRVQVLTGLSYVKRGGADSVEYTLSEPSVRDGVMVGDTFFPGRPHPIHPERRFVVFAVPTTAPANPSIRVVAEDEAGNVGTGRWSIVLRERVLPEASVSLPQSFLDVTVADLADAHDIDASDLHAAFQIINTKMRAANEKKIREVTAHSGDVKLWEGAFDQLSNSKVTSRFAEQRTYFAGGRQNSEAIHYGYDLASTAKASVNAANHGRVVFADELGIYGNCVIIDHGLGLATLYGHLSEIDVDVGDEIRKGDAIGLSGATGLAGGDHLHFAVLVGDSYVDPLEWWDRSWVRKHIDERLAPAETE